MRLIDADELLKRVDEERQYLLARGQEGAEHILVNNFRVLIDKAPTIERPQGEYTIGELKKWLYEIVFNNDNDFGMDCLEIIDRLDGFERFVADMRGGKR